MSCGIATHRLASSMGRTFPSTSPPTRPAWAQWRCGPRTKTNCVRLSNARSRRRGPWSSTFRCRSTLECRGSNRGGTCLWRKSQPCRRSMRPARTTFRTRRRSGFSTKAGIQGVSVDNPERAAIYGQTLKDLSARTGSTQKGAESGRAPAGKGRNCSGVEFWGLFQRFPLLAVVAEDDHRAFAPGEVEEFLRTGDELFLVFVEGPGLAVDGEGPGERDGVDRQEHGSCLG